MCCKVGLLFWLGSPLSTVSVNLWRSEQQGTCVQHRKVIFLDLSFDIFLNMYGGIPSGSCSWLSG